MILNRESINQNNNYPGLNQIGNDASGNEWDRIRKIGSPLFISAQVEATGPIQKPAIKECLKMASQNLPFGEPLDWRETTFPEKWKLDKEIETFNWN